MTQYVWLDTETTGLDPLVHGIVEIGAVIEAPKKDSKIFSGLCNPGDVEISAYALEVNGLSLEYLQSQEEKVEELVVRFDRQVERGAVICGHNVAGFDIPFLKEAYKKAKLSWRFHHHCVDTMVAANVLKYWGVLPKNQSLSLQNMLEYFSLTIGGAAHRALPDVYASMALNEELKKLTLGGNHFAV